LLRIPITPRDCIFLILKVSDHHSSFIDDQNLRKGSVTITETSVTISFSKVVGRYEPLGCIGMDINERNVTVLGTDGYERRFDGLGEVSEIKERYGEVRGKLSKLNRRDKRIGKELLVKYGRREMNRTRQRIHKMTKTIIDYAGGHRLGIKTEKLTCIHGNRNEIRVPDRVLSKTRS
jgi:putative transposase